MRALFLLLAAALATAAGAAPPLQGKVSHVSDGDSLWVTLAETRPPAGGAPPRSAQRLEVRLAGIDAPEFCQNGGPEAQAALRERVLGQPVTLDLAGRDRYGRTLATLTHAGVNVNEWLVAEGHAWSARSKWDQGPYVKFERMARALRRGVHDGGDVETAADFRRRHGPCRRPAGRRSSAPARP